MTPASTPNGAPGDRPRSWVGRLLFGPLVPVLRRIWPALQLTALENFRTYLPRVLAQARPYWGLVLLAGAGLPAAAMVGLAAPWPLKVLVDNALGAEPLPPVLDQFLGPLADSRTALIGVVVAAELGVALLMQSLGVFNGWVTAKLTLNMTLDFRAKLFDHTQRLGMSYHDRRRSGMELFRINYMDDAPTSLLMTLMPLLQELVTLVGMVWISLLIHRNLALLSLIVVPFLYYSISYYSSRIKGRIYTVRAQEGETMSIIHEGLAMFRVVAAFGRERHELQRLLAQGRKANLERIRLTIRQNFFSFAVAMTTAIGAALVLGYGATEVLAGRLTIGQLLVILTYIGSIYTPLESLSSSLADIQEQLVNIDLAFNLLDRTPEVADRPGATPLEEVKGHLAFDQVDFDYEGRSDVLRGVSFEVPAGQAVGIVGPTGAGKTTLANLIPRFYDPKAGSVLIDGQDVRNFTVESLRRHMSVVLQEPLLFSTTIKDNIRYGRLDASDAEIEAAAQAANAHEFIDALPKGYDTEVGERGAQLSGGERQRIGIARAFLKNAPILILDEPTSSIDSKTEAGVLEALDQLMIGRTTVLVAHRLSTLRNIGRIVVVNKGHQVEAGTHEELLRQDGLYRQLHDLQSGQVRERVLEVLRTVEVEATAPELARADETRAAPAGADAPVPAVASDPPPEAPVVARPMKVVVLGTMTKMPVAGIVFITMQYVVGLRRLGYDVYYVEAHARTPSMFMTSPDDDSSALAAAFIADTMRRFGLEDDHWAFHALHDDGRCYGLSESQLRDLYRSAGLILNLHGGTTPRPEHYGTNRLVYLGTDPVEHEIGVHQGDEETIRYLEPHCAFFTWGENYGKPDCRLPWLEDYAFKPTRQPVVRDLWEWFGVGGGDAFTTIGSWRQPWRIVSFEGETYTWSKHVEFLKLIDLPRRTEQPFELALSSYEREDRALLEQHGWRVRDGLPLSTDIDRYRVYIGRSRGEFTVAKDQNVRLRSGWFSDRSAAYLATGRPVITQETGFSNLLPTGEGLFAFVGLDDILTAVDRINADPARHAVAAKAIAREYFDHEVVLGRMMADLGQ